MEATQKSRRPLKKILNDLLPNESFELLFYDEAFFRRESTITRLKLDSCENIFSVTY